MMPSSESFNLENFFNLSADLFCIAGYDGYFRKINPAVSTLLGYTQEELMSRPIREFIHPEDKEITARYREKILQNVPLLNFENRYVTKSGEIVWLSWTSMPSQEEELVYAIAKNVTYKKKQEEDRNKLLSDLTKINAELKHLTYTTSHDLRSPVINLLAVFSLLDVSTIQDPETIEFINMLRSATETLKNTLNNYVDILKSKEGLNVPVEQVRFQDSFNSIANALKSLLDQSGAHLEADFSELETVMFNKGYLDSIFLNLITNSIKYALPGVLPVIRIFSTRVEGVNQLIFSDNGRGFDMEEVKDKIFGLHQRFHNDDHIESKGIGLYLVHNHITGLGGSIKVESAPNKGTRFVITFKD